MGALVLLCKCLKTTSVLTLYSPESSGETDGSAAGEGAEGAELYQTEDGKHIAASLPVKK